MPDFPAVTLDPAATPSVPGVRTGGTALAGSAGAPCGVAPWDAGLARLVLQAFDASPSGMAIIQLPEGRYLHANRAFCTMVGRAPDQLLTLTVSDIRHPCDGPLTNDYLPSADAGEAADCGQRRYVRADGSVLCARRRITVMREDSGIPTAALVQYEDAEEVGATAARARISEQFVGSVLDSLGTRAGVLDSSGTVTATNHAWTHVDTPSPYHGASAATGIDYLALLEGMEGDPFATRAATGIREVLAGHADEYLLDYPAQTTPNWFRLHVNRMRDGSGAVVSHTDITSRRQNEERMAFSLLHDELTGLPNRTLFFDRLTQAVARSGRRLTSTAVLLLDLDDFKLVNDSLGHQTGDLLLMEVANRLSGALRPGDTVARFGGDEFAILCEELVGEEQALDLAERLLAVLEEPLNVATRQVAVTGSIGIALSGEDTTAQSLLRDADAAMYRSKERGRGHCELFDQRLHHRALRRLDLEQDLRLALEKQEFFVAYQPVVDLGSGIATHVEALVRWMHPERGLVLPTEFIPVAEDTGQIVAVGRWVLGEACRQAAEWKRDLGLQISVAVNLSTKQLADPHLVSTVQQTLRETGLPGHWLRLEITESAIMQDPNAAVEVMRRLRHLGVRLSVDDFGTGYSSLAYLRRFPVDQLKIDRSFVTALDNGADDIALVSTIIDLAHNLRMGVIAEGVERIDQAELLAGMGCDEAQGYLFAKPMSAAEVAPLLGVKLPLPIPPAPAPEPAPQHGHPPVSEPRPQR